MISAEVTDAVTTTAMRLEAYDFASVDELRAYGRNVATFSPEMEALNRELKSFLLEKFYRHWRVNRMAAKAQRILRDLFTSYCTDPGQLPPDAQARLKTEPEGIERAICDYIAGMTDRYAIQDHLKMFDPETRV